MHDHDLCPYCDNPLRGSDAGWCPVHGHVSPSGPFFEAKGTPKWLGYLVMLGIVLFIAGAMGGLYLVLKMIAGWFGC